MQIAISGHHLEITDGIRNVINTKISKVASHYPDLNSLDAILTVEKKNQQVEISTQYLGSRVSVHASNSDMYCAIASAAKKLDSALGHRKGSLKHIKHEKPSLKIIDTQTD